MIPAMTRSPLIRVGFAVVLCLLPAPRSPLPVVVEYPLPRPKAFPHDPAVGADGIVWYTDQANSYIGRLDPATGKVTDYATRSEEHTSELQSQSNLVCRLLLEKKKKD